MIAPSPEIEGIVRRWTNLIRTHRVEDLPHYLSRSEALIYIGTADGESWRGQLVRDGIADHMAEVPDFIEEDVEIDAWENGDTGWANYKSRFTFPGTGTQGVHRATFVFVLERGSWKMVQHHISQPDSNVAKMGVDHNAFASLIAAAQATQHDFGTEGLASIMFTDIVNSSTLATATGDRAWSAIVADHFAALRRIIEEHDGQFVKSLGDGTMSSFASARKALAAARAIQRHMASRDIEPRLGLRIGVHTGDVVQSDDDFFGSVVNKSARITAVADPGDIVVSDVTRAMVGDAPDFVFEAPQSIPLKGFTGKTTLFRLVWKG
ncbi:nuclear transport factor 2 family protein [Tateyamaria armeniaca]|uniref:Nuclear transport factor 2 family protein n=1 Tax=Tateyamaria armeniaca TaxID=2518930 RepID=A0ABW8V1E1_9RHOB